MQDLDNELIVQIIAAADIYLIFFHSKTHYGIISG